MPPKATMPPKQEGFIRTLTEDDFARAFLWLECCRKCVRISYGSAGKKLENTSSHNYNHFQNFLCLQFVVNSHRRWLFLNVVGTEQNAFLHVNVHASYWQKQICCLVRICLAKSFLSTLSLWSSELGLNFMVFREWTA
jgi:hypothetical protein